MLGESRMGFFSKHSIKEGDEITFDYSFEIFGYDLLFYLNNFNYNVKNIFFNVGMLHNKSVIVVHLIVVGLLVKHLE